MDPAQPLKDLQKQNEFFVGIDSDGCVFDTMGIKQRECFCPWMVKYFNLQPVAQAARECKDFADLFSKSRGQNRHTTLALILRDILPKHPMVKIRKFDVPQIPHYYEWVDDPNSILSNAALKQAADAANGEAKRQLELAYEWSEKVNAIIKEIVYSIPPFPFVRESLEKLKPVADRIVCSQTPTEALVREWHEHNIDGYVSIIAGQEMGTKTEHLALASRDQYDKKKCLMIGDAPGDRKAAKANDMLFYPINPGHEEASWQRFYEESIDKFLAGEFAGDYEAKLIAEFDSYLPEHPPWEK